MTRFRIAFAVVCVTVTCASWQPHASPAKESAVPKRGKKIKDPVPQIPGWQKKKPDAEGYRPSLHDPAAPTSATVAKQARLKQLLDSLRLSSKTPEEYERSKREVWGD